MIKNEQDTQSGGSGCGCSAIVLDTLVLDKLRKRRIKKGYYLFLTRAIVIAGKL